MAPAQRLTRLYEIAAARPRLWFYPLAALVLFSWLARVWLLVHEGGLFRVVGIDFSMYLAQARILRDGQAQSIYDLSLIQTYLQALRVYTTDPNLPLSAGPVAYAPVFAGLMMALTLPPPPLALAAWTLLNLLGVGYVAWRVTQLVPGVGPLQAMLALLISFPVAVGLVGGQPTALLACAVGECYLALRAGRDLRAGLWLSLLLLKPQYGILIGPVLIWKRRWNAVLGVALGGALILACSVLVVGFEPLSTYWLAVADIAPWGGAAVASPGQMINWRALILNLRPSAGPTTGLLFVAAAGLLSALTALSVWRGPWAARSWTFAPRVAALALTTVLANYHSHSHGLALFAIPVAASLGEPRVRRITRVALLALAFLPSLVIIAGQHWFWRELIQHQPVDVLIWSPLAQMLLVLATGCLLRDVLSPQRERADVDERAGRESLHQPAPPLMVSNLPSASE
jgi:hypothetical protein